MYAFPFKTLNQTNPPFFSIAWPERLFPTFIQAAIVVLY
jgi:hypothetical protein